MSIDLFLFCLNASQNLCFPYFSLVKTVKFSLKRFKYLYLGKLAHNPLFMFFDLSHLLWNWKSSWQGGVVVSRSTCWCPGLEALISLQRARQSGRYLETTSLLAWILFKRSTERPSSETPWRRLDSPFWRQNVPSTDQRSARAGQGLRDAQPLRPRPRPHHGRSLG